jgi:hypothetical protein
MAKLRGLVADADLPMDMPPELERHRTRSSALPGWNKVIGGARLVGDATLAEAAINGAARQCATGAMWPDRPLAAGSAAFGGHLIVRWSAPLGLSDLNQRGYVAPSGPLLATGPEEPILVVLARSSDGVTLDLAVTPRRRETRASSTVTAELRFTALQPDRSYVLSPSRGTSIDDARATPEEGGAPALDPTRFTADATGTAIVALEVGSLKQFRLSPEPAPASGAA